MTRAVGGVTETHGQWPITLVTGYFDLGQRYEHPDLGNPYPCWIRNFLPHVRWPLVIFCDEQSVGMLKEARGDKPAVYHVTRLEEFYSYRYLDDLKRLLFSAERAEVIIARSLIWHEKHHFLRQALSENPFGSEMLFWCDIGMFRYGPSFWWGRALRSVCLLLKGHSAWSQPLSRWGGQAQFRRPEFVVNRRSAALRWFGRAQFRLIEEFEWPNLEVCRTLPQDKVILSSGLKHDNFHIHACFFGGAVEPARRWCDAYYRRLEKRKQNGNFIHYEEYVMLSCWKRRRELAYVLPFRPVPYILRKRGRGGHNFRWYFLNGRRFPWKYFWRRLFFGPAR